MALNGEAYTSHGGYTNSCSFNCSFGYVSNQSQCWVKMAIITTRVSLVFQIDAATFGNSKSSIIQAFANASGCGPCVNTSSSSVYCGICIIEINTIRLVTTARRLLATWIEVNASIQSNGTELQARDVSKKSLDATGINREFAAISIPPAMVTGAISSVVVLPPIPPVVVKSIEPPTSTATTTTPPPLPPLPPVPTPSPSDSGSSSTGLIAGAAGGGVVGIGLIGVVIYCALKPPPPPIPPKKESGAEPKEPLPRAQARASLVYYDATKKKSTLRISMSNPVLNRPHQICR
jgi:hypothetical protein